MSGLIPLTTTGEGVQAVMGRDLHHFLEVTTRYNDWMSRLIEKYGFGEGQDYVLKNEYVPGSNGRQYEQVNHILTLDMAKELSMVQNNSKGRQARQYFIECERRANAPLSELDEAQLVQRAIQVQYQKIQRLEAENLAMLPKAAYVDTFVAGEDLIEFRTLANQLQVGEKELRELLIEHKWIYRKTGNRWSNKKNKIVSVNQYRAYADKKHLFRLVPCHEAPRVNGEVQQSLKVTPVGAQRISVAVKRWGGQRVLGVDV